MLYAVPVIVGVSVTLDGSPVTVTVGAAMYAGLIIVPFEPSHSLAFSVASRHTNISNVVVLNQVVSRAAFVLIAGL